MRKLSPHRGKQMSLLQLMIIPGRSVALADADCGASETEPKALDERAAAYVFPACGDSQLVSNYHSRNRAIRVAVFFERITMDSGIIIFGSVLIIGVDCVDAGGGTRCERRSSTRPGAAAGRRRGGGTYHSNRARRGDGFSGSVGLRFLPFRVQSVAKFNVADAGGPSPHVMLYDVISIRKRQKL